MAYSFQTFSAGQILTAAQMNQVEVNIRDHVHGAAGVDDLSGNHTLTGIWTYNNDLIITGTTSKLRLVPGRDTYIDSIDNAVDAHIFVSQAGVGDFGQEAGHLIIQPRMVSGGVYRDIIFAGGNTAAVEIMRISGEGNVGIGGTPTTKFHVYDDSTIFSTTFEQANGAGKILQLKATVSDNLNTTSAFDIEIDAVSVLRVTNAGNIAIGNVTPDTTLHVYRGNSGGSSSIYSGLTVEDDTDVFLQILTPNTSVGGILFGDPEGSSVGQIRYDHSANILSFFTGGSQQISINATGQLVSSLATGTAPFSVASTTTVANLSANSVQNQTPSDLRARSTHTGTQAPSTISPQGVGSGLDADTVDGSHASAFATSGHDHIGVYVAGNYTAGNASGNVPISNGTVNTNLNADMVGGLSGSSSVIGFKRGITTFNTSDVSMTASFNIFSDISNTWESVGPTGSGATNIWGALDYLPTNAIAVIVKINVRNPNNTLNVYGRMVGDTTGVGDYTRLTDVQAGGYQVVQHTISVASRQFDLFREGGATSGACVMTLVGWIS